MQPYTIHRFAVGPYNNNCYVLEDPASGDHLVIDAPPDALLVLRAIEGKRVSLVLITHNHGDHIASVAMFREALRCPIAAHPADAHAIRGPVEPLAHGQEVPLGQHRVRVLHTPGHTPGSVCFLLDNHLFSGDTLFPNGPGHTRTPEDFRQIVRSIQEQLFTLPDDVTVYPGHGATTTIGVEKARYAQFAARPQPPDLCGDVLWVPEGP